mmetsp:Transcript_10246/g.19390  ORF Transcript_10246/g.19390 Transcript_10246/m.19390 type:complete len:231 (+) Transcript_10246:278-970(+)
MRGRGLEVCNLGMKLAGQRVKSLRIGLEVLQLEDGLRMGQVVLLQVVVQAGARSSEVWNAGTDGDARPAHHNHALGLSAAHSGRHALQVEARQNMSRRRRRASRTQPHFGQHGCQGRRVCFIFCIVTRASCFLVLKRFVGLDTRCLCLLTVLIRCGGFRALRRCIRYYGVCYRFTLLARRRSRLGHGCSGCRVADNVGHVPYIIVRNPTSVRGIFVTTDLLSLLFLVFLF